MIHVAVHVVVYVGAFGVGLRDARPARARLKESEIVLVDVEVVVEVAIRERDDV